MEGVAEAGFERRAIECRRLRRDRQVLEHRRHRAHVEAAGEVARGPALEHRVLERQHREVAARAHRRQGDRVAVERRQQVDRRLERRVVRIAEAREQLLAERRVRRRRVGEPCQVLRRRELLRRAPAVAVQDSLIDPLQVHQAVEQRVDVGEEVDLRRCRHPAEVEHGLVDDVVERAEVGRQRRCVVRRRDHDPRRVDRQLGAAEAHARGDRAVGDVVGPAVVVREGGERRAAGRERATAAAEHEQAALRVGAQLAQVDRLAQEGAGVERLRGRVAAGNGAGAGVDHQGAARAAQRRPRCAAAPAPPRGCRARCRTGTTTPSRWRGGRSTRSPPRPRSARAPRARRRRGRRRGSAPPGASSRRSRPCSRRARSAGRPGSRGRGSTRRRCCRRARSRSPGGSRRARSARSIPRPAGRHSRRGRAGPCLLRP